MLLNSGYCIQRRYCDYGFGSTSLNKADRSHHLGGDDGTGEEIASSIC